VGREVDLTGADLVGTNFVSANVPDSIVDSPTFTSSIVQKARFGTHEGDSFAGASFAGVDLSGAQLGRSESTLDLTGADFTGVTVVQTYFANVDLTGSTFAELKFGSSMYIGPDVTCPDGASSTEGKYGAAACRL